MKNLFSFLIIAALFAGSLVTQTANATFAPGYTRDSLTGLSYDSLLTLSGATKVTAVQSGTADDGSMFINLPFAFNFNGSIYNRVTVSTNGWIAMDSTTSTTFTPNLFSNTTAAPINVIGGWFRDNNLNTANQGMWVHQQKIVGTDTIYVIEYRNFSGASGGGTSSTLQFNMQVWLYKTSNKIEMRYGPILGAITQSAALGLKDDGLGAVPHFYNALFNNSTTTTLSTAWPSAGNGYRYNPIIPAANDVGTTVILNPVDGGGSGNQAPVATIKNFGTNPQSGYNVTCTISPGGYFFTTLAPLLTTGNTANINFANVNLAANVSYTVTVYTSLPGDQNHSNDTQRVIVSLINANNGNDSGYFYANTLATTQPSFPSYCWKDTTGSISIVQGGVVAPGNTLVGGLDDGYFILSLKNILLSFGIDTTDKHLKYNGVCYDSIFPGTNGIIGMTQDFGTYSLTDFNIDGAQVAKNALLALWHDVNFATAPTSGTNRLSYKAKGNQLILTYDRAVSFAPTTDWVSYQVVIEIVTGCASPNSNFRYTYADTTNGNTSASFLNNYLAQYPSATGLVTTFRNYITGYSQNGAPIAYAGYVSSANPFPASPSTQMNIKRPLYNLVNGSGLAVEFGPNINSLSKLNCNLMLTLRIAIQGFQSSLNPAERRVRDTVEIYIRAGAGAPYSILASYKVLLDSGYSGYAFGYKNLPDALLKSAPQFIEVRQRNTVSVWSNLINPVSDTVYDFTTGVNKTYGNNSIITNGVASMYSGDVDAPVIEIQDGCITLTDVLKVSNDATTFTSGSYVLTDLNYDGQTTLADVLIAYNNNTNFVCKVQPPGALAPYDHPVINVLNINNSNAPVIYITDPNFKDKSESSDAVKTESTDLKK